MNIQNLGSQESVEVKYIDSIYAEFRLRLWFESDWYSCKITESNGFKCDPETKFQTVTSYSQFRSSRMQMFFKLGVL